MSRLYDALQRSESESSRHAPHAGQQTPSPSDLLREVESESLGFEQILSLRPAVRPHSRLVAMTDQRGLGAEKFRLLGTRLKYLQEQRQVRKILVTSSVAEEGKSLIAANLAITLARRARQKVLLLEADLRQPTLAQLFGLNGLKGLSNYLQTQEPVTKFFYRLSGLQLWFLPSGPTPKQPLELLQSGRLSELISQFTGWFDWVVIDSPPLLPLADANWWSRLTDGILLVVREGKTPKKLLQKALETLDNPRLLGVVLNDASGADIPYYERYYGARLGGGTREDKKSTVKEASS